jgi:hypothetical protein
VDRTWTESTASSSSSSSRHFVTLGEVDSSVQTHCWLMVIRDAIQIYRSNMLGMIRISIRGNPPKNSKY